MVDASDFVRGMTYFPLRNTTALDEWWERDDPPVSVWNTVTAWVYGLEDGYWQYPSVPWDEFSNRPNYEYRTATVPKTSVVVVYQYHHIEVWTDLLYVG